MLSFREVFKEPDASCLFNWAIIASTPPRSALFLLLRHHRTAQLKEQLVKVSLVVSCMYHPFFILYFKHFIK